MAHIMSMVGFVADADGRFWCKKMTLGGTRTDDHLSSSKRLILGVHLPFIEKT